VPDVDLHGQWAVVDAFLAAARAGDFERLLAFPLEDARARAAYGVQSGVNKLLIVNREVQPGRITIVLVDEVLGF
jgi:hypothetical protein